jgi:iron complex transport system ATP-binding protein
MIPALDVARLVVRVGEKILLDDVSLRIAPGESVALVGPNGAGKSTLLRVLSGEMAASGGSVKLKGRNPRSYASGALANERAVLSQDISVSFPFLVREIVRMGAGENSGAAVDMLVDAALAEVDLGGFPDRVIGTLSGGEQQRVHFARVLVQLAYGERKRGPGILLLDEPTASLDLRHQLDIVAAARRRAAAGTTVVTILHDLNLAALLAERIIMLGNGRVVADGTAQDTITEVTLSSVFGVVSAVSQIPRDTIPFVLPHSAKKKS